jgi:hypothetical protein
MRTVRGHFNGSVVVLDEPAPVDHEVEVNVQFPELDAAEAQEQPAGEWRYHWHETRKITEGSHIDSTDIIRAMRDED